LHRCVSTTNNDTSVAFSFHFHPGSPLLGFINGRPIILTVSSGRRPPSSFWLSDYLRCSGRYLSRSPVDCSGSVAAARRTDGVTSTSTVTVRRLSYLMLTIYKHQSRKVFGLHASEGQISGTTEQGTVTLTWAAGCKSYITIRYTRSRQFRPFPPTRRIFTTADISRRSSSGSKQLSKWRCPRTSGRWLQSNQSLDHLASKCPPTTARTGQSLTMDARLTKLGNFPDLF
jgi:hypothetical protein